MAATGGTLEHRVVRLTTASAIWIVGTLVGLVVARRMFIAAHRPLSWAAASAVVAMLVDPFVENLALRIRRVPAVLLTFLALGAVGVGTTYLVFDDVQHALDRLQTAAPEAAATIEARQDRLGEVARDGHLSDRVDSFVQALDERATGGADVLRSTAGTAPTYFLCAILTVFLLTYGPRIASAALAQDPDVERRRRVEAIAVLALQRARRAVVLTLGVATLLGLIGTAIANWLDLPAPAGLGFAIGVMALLPHVGLIVGSIPLLLLTVGFRSGTMAILLALAVIVVQVLDSVVVRAWIARRSVHIGLLAPWVVALLGYAVYGIGAAAYATIAAIFVLAVLDQAQVAHAVGPPPQAEA
ncbi:MAG: AI-2E family transporter [Microthrixaceae bacterium]